MKCLQVSPQTAVGAIGPSDTLLLHSSQISLLVLLGYLIIETLHTGEEEEVVDKEDEEDEEVDDDDDESSPKLRVGSLSERVD